MTVIVRAPGSSANLGPGFDALGLAIARYAEGGVVGETDPPDGASLADDSHPATIAYRRAGGAGALWLRSQLPMGRGLGYSGAVRVVGATLGLLEREPGASILGDAAHRSHPDALRLRAEVLEIAAALEGHGDNAAASVCGSVVAVAGDVCVEVPLALDPVIVVWVPDATTGTDASRRTLPEQLSRADAAFNVGRVAVLVAALGAGRIDALRVGAEDRMHQDHRLAHQPRSAATLRALLDAGAWSAWLSGSGPTVAAFAGREDADRLAAALPAEGRAMVLELDRHGVIWE